jgi:RHS repeat-associated protein
LAGPAPSNVYPLASQNSVLTTYDLLDKIVPTDKSGLSNKLDLDRHLVSLQKGILVPANGPYNFAYQVQPPKYVENCGATLTAPTNYVITTTGTKCYNCVLNAKLSLLDECGKELFSSIFPASTSPAPKNFTTTGVQNVSCSSPAPSLLSLSFPVLNTSHPTNYAWLSPGNYILEKTLSINEDALDFYTEDYLDSTKNTCILKLSDFKASQNLLMDVSGCGITCATCLTKLGPYANYTAANNCTVCLTPEEYDVLKRECEDMCSTKSNICEGGLGMLLADFSPSGQYAQYSPGGGSTSGGNITPPQPNNIKPWLFPLSVFNENNNLPFRKSTQLEFAGPPAKGAYGAGYAPNWRHPFNPTVTDDPLTPNVNERFAYLDDDKKAVLIKITPDGSGNFIPVVGPYFLSVTNNKVQNIGGEFFVEPRYLLNLKDFLDLWQSEWAYSLIAHHPEYPQYERCVADGASNDFDASYTELDKISAAQIYVATINNTDPNLFMYPVGKPPATSGPCTGFTGPIVDPYFNGGNGTAKLCDMQTAMQNFRLDPTAASGYLSMWELVYRIVNCPNGNVGTICVIPPMPANYVFTTDEEWNVFKSLYLSLKQTIQGQINTDHSIQNTFSYNGCIGAKPFNPIENKFYDPSAWTIVPYPNWGNYPWFWFFWPSFTNSSQYFNFEQTCNSSRHYYYSDKKPRFATSKMLMGDAIGTSAQPCYDDLGNIITCPETDADALNNMSNQADMANYLNCKQCPKAANFQTLLKALNTLSTTAGQNDLLNGTSPGVRLTCAPATSIHKEFTVEIAENIFGAGAPTSDIYWLYDNANSTATSLTGIFDHGGIKCRLEMEFPSAIIPTSGIPGIPSTYAPFGNIYTFKDILEICCVKHTPAVHTFPFSGAQSGSDRFTMQVTVQVKSGDPLFDPNIVNQKVYREITVEGYFPCIDFENCTFQPVCAPSLEIKRAQNLLNALLLNNPSTSTPDIFSTSASGVALNVLPYTGFMQPDLIKDLDKNVDPTVNNLGDPWLWKHTSSSGKTLIGYFAATAASQQCNVTITLPALSTFNAVDIKQITGIKPSSAASPAFGDFEAFALVRNTPTNAKWEKITGNISCLSAGKCGSEISTSMQINANSDEEAITLGLDACSLSNYGTTFEAHLKTLSNPICSTCTTKVYTASYSDVVNTPNASCNYTLSFPAGSVYTFSDVASISDIIVDPRNASTTTGYNFFFAVAVINIPSTSATATVILDGYVPCINLGSCVIPTNAANDCQNVGNIILNGDFEAGNTGFNSDFKYNNKSALSYNNDPTIGFAAYVPPGSGMAQYNVYSVKNLYPVNSLNPTNSNSDHTAYMSYPPIIPGDIPFSATGTGQALVARSENPIVDFVTTFPTDVWSQTVNLKPNTTYTFGAFYKGEPAGQFSYDGLVCELYINNVLIKQFSTCKQQVFWQEINYSFNSGTNGNNTKISLRLYYDNFTQPANPSTICVPQNAPLVNNADHLFMIDDISLVGCMLGNSLICTIPPFVTEEAEDDCTQDAENVALETAEYFYNQYIDSLRNAFRAQYVAKCLDAYEDFTMTAFDSEHHYTLYYYDEAGNLVKTVPPQGVVRLPDNTTTLSQIMQDRKNKTQTVFTTHTYASNYKYNSLNQLVGQSVPDNVDLAIWNPSDYTGVGSGQNVQSVAFNGSNGVLVSNSGTNGFMYTFNAASNSWVPAGNLTVSNLNDVVYTGTPGEAYAVGKDGTVMRTFDNGITWDFMPFPESGAELIKVRTSTLAGPNVVVYDKDGNQWVSSFSGTLWAKSFNVFGFVAGEKLLDIKFTFPSTGVAISSLNNIYTSSGGSWTKNNNVKPVSLNKVSGDGTAVMYSVGKDGTLLKSINSGTSWIEIPNQFKDELVDVAFYSQYAGFVLDINGKLYQTFNGGASFIDISSGGPVNIKAIALDAANNRIYAMANTGAYNYYTYAGFPIQWGGTPVSSPVSGTFNSLSVANGKVYVGGNGGLFYKYDSGWTNLNSPSGEDVISVSIIPSSGTTEMGYFITKSGITRKVYEFTSVGNVISPVTLAGTAYNSVKTISSTLPIKAYAVGDAGSLVSLGTLNNEIVTNSAADLKNVYLNTANDLVAVGQNVAGAVPPGEIMAGNAAAATPTYIDYSTKVTPPQLTAVATTAVGDAYACGGDGTILQYNIASNNWETQVTASNTQLNTISSDASGNVVSAGLKGSAATFEDHIISKSGTIWTPPFTNGSEDFFNSTIISGDVFFIGKNRSIYKAAVTSLGTQVAATGVTAGTEKFLGIADDGSNNIKVVGETGLIYGGLSTTNAFVSENNFNPPVLNDVKWFDNTHVIAVGNNGAVVVSDNAGASWKTVSPCGSEHLRAVDILNANTAIAVGDNSAYRSISFTCTGPTCNYSCISPSPNPSSGTTNFVDVSCSNGDILVIDNSNAYYKPTALASWAPSSGISLGGGTFRSVYMVDNSFACAVGMAGDVTTLVPGGLISIQASLGQNLNSVYFKDYITGYAAGDNGFLYKTVNGGVVWTSEAVPSTIGTNNINVVVPNGSNNIALGANGNTSGTILDNKNEISSRFYYDKLGRLVASQNSKQFAKNPLTYSYTKYDALGRITEVGEVLAATDIELLPNTKNAQVDLGDFAIWIASGNAFSEITNTFYDDAIPAINLPAPYDGANGPLLTQENLRNRVSFTTYQDDLISGIKHATFYSYDIHGNVKSLYQYNADLVAGNKYKRTDYDYDLISGKVNNVKYQENAADQFLHNYIYDDDNRITNVNTSKDGVIWDQDAKYFYYRHGPLSRTEIGDNKVQGTDYAYTLHGWIKGINSNKLSSETDQGGDAIALASNSINDFITQDAMGYSLGYYKNDYKSITFGTTPTASSFLADETGSPLEQPTGPNNREMFNGNINHVTNSIKQFMNTSGKPQAMLYQYDQLNRLVEAVSFDDYNTTTNTWNNTPIGNKFKEYFSYDGNGNILTSKRFDDVGVVMDSLNYSYNNIASGVIKNTNQLNKVTDVISGSGPATDLESGQVTDNYLYDNTGNLIEDKQEEIDDITWTVYGKIKEIKRFATSTKPDIEFNYDAQGNRVSKIVKTKASPGVLNPNTSWEYTYYSRDAQGNIMATYKDGASVSNALTLSEQNLFGSSRLGMINRNENMTLPYTPGDIFERESGAKSFELNNHLGNVMTVVSDRKLSVDDGVYNASGVQTSSTADGTIDYYQPDILAANDYYSFGMVMNNRKYIGPAGAYRFGFNGKENDRESVSTGEGIQDYGMRIYNPAIGKFLSVDPITAEYPWYTPYQYAGNKPIQFIDKDGLEEANPEMPGNNFKSAIDNARAGLSMNYHINKDILSVIKQNKLNTLNAFNKMEKDLGVIKSVNWQEKYFEGKSDFERVLTTDPSMQFAAQSILGGGVGKIIFNSNSLAAGKLGGAFADFTTQQVANNGDFNKYNIVSTLGELNPFKNVLTSAVYQGVTSSFFATEGFDYKGIGSTGFNDASFFQAAKMSAFNIGGNIIGDLPGAKLDRFGIPYSVDFLQSYMFNSFGNVISNKAADTFAPSAEAPPKSVSAPKKPIN